jgi:glyoxylase-like metal-dependent hydrolase (beta-lactamase superfamily II)
MRIERVLAPNPGPYTGPGTNTWLVDDNGLVVIIDPGPLDDGHADQIVAAVEGRSPIGIVVTHTHPDHAPLANPLGRRLGIPCYGYAAGPEFVPDITLGRGDTIKVGASMIEVLHTPGHAADHLCFLCGRALFTGDHIMGGSSVLVEDMTAYLESLRRLAEIPLDVLYPGHGETIDRPGEVIDWYIAHRLQREAEIVRILGSGPAGVDEIVEQVYADLDAGLYPLATLNVAAHLRKLAEEGRVVLAGDKAELAS